MTRADMGVFDGGGEKRTAAILDEELCIGCGACIDVCPEQAIDMGMDAVVIDRQKCTGCGSCEVECPNEAISQSDL